MYSRYFHVHDRSSPEEQVGLESALHDEDFGDDSEATWSRREAARMRQIMIGKARPEYRRYIAEVHPDDRDPAQPSTPNPKDRVSKRQFDRALGDWRRRLHEFDAEMGWASSSEPPSAVAPVSPPASTPSPQRARRSRGGRNVAAVGSNDRPSPVAKTEVSDASVVATPGIVKLRLADQLPEPPALPQMLGLPDYSTPDYVPSAASVAAAAAALSVVSGHSLPWPLPCDPDHASLLAAATMGATDALAALFGQQQLEHREDPETPCRPQRTLFPYEDFETPPPVDFQATYHHALTSTLDIVREEPFEKGVRLTYEEAFYEPPSAAERWPSPPRRAAPLSPGVPLGSPVPRTPPRSKVTSIRSPPSSVVRTPTRGLWAMETPSPERFYPHSQHLNTQMMPPPMVYSTW